MCTQSPSKSAPKRRIYKRFDFDCMVIVDIYIKSLERMLRSIGWPMKKPSILVNYSPANLWTNLPIPKATSSIVCQLAGQKTEEMLVVRYYPDATLEDASSKQLVA